MDEWGGGGGHTNLSATRASLSSPMLVQFLLVAIGGALGSAMRFGVGLALPHASPQHWPWATFAVNMAGCLAIGIVMGLALRGEGTGLTISPTLRVFLVTGLLGGFTTFSAFGFETLRMMQAGQPMLAVAYALSSAALGVVAAGAGWMVAR
jgi:CrcB protein